jgi:hypothetical protein
VGASTRLKVLVFLLCSYADSISRGHRVGPYEGAAVAVVVVMAMAMIMTAVVMAIAAATVVMMTGMAMVTQSDGCPGETPFRLAS